jgi:hypothetical protein
MGRKGKYSVKDFGGTTDALINTSKYASESDQAELTVSQYMARLRDEATKNDRNYLEAAIRNERYFHGVQYEPESAHDVDDPASDQSAGGPSKNYTRNLCQTWASRFQEDRPIIRAYPGQAEGRDIMAAAISNQVLEEFHWRENMDAKLWQSAIYAQLHGKVATWTTWDAEKGREILAPKMDPLTEEALLDEDGSEILESLGAEGEVSAELLTIFDYDYFGADDVEEAFACVRYKWVDEVQARAFIHKNTGVMVDVSAETYATPFGARAEGVKVEHLCVLPNDMIPNGLWAIIVGGHVAVSEDYPEGYSGMLPLNEYKVNPVRGSKFATSHVNDAIPLQRFINEMERAKVETVHKVGVPKLIGLAEVVDSYEPGVHAIALDDLNQINQGARFLEPPAPSPLIWDSQEGAVQDLFDIFGLNEVLSGKDSVKSGTSAKQIAYLSRLDSMKMSGAVRNFERFYIRMMRLVLSLTRHYVREERLIRMVGPGGEVQYQAFRGSDLDGVDVHLEPNSGLEKFRAQQSAEMGEQLQTGQVDPATANERSETGLDQTLSQGVSAAKASRLLMAVFRGEQVQPDPSIPPPIAIQTLQQGLGVIPAADQTIHQLIQAYQQMMQQAQMNQQAGGPQEGPKPGANPNLSRRPQNRRGQPTPELDATGPGLAKRGGI